MLNEMFKSIIDQDRAAVVICDTECKIVYMNPAAIAQYHGDITGRDLRECHNSKSVDKIERVVEWFGKNRKNNIVFTHHNDKHNRDVYMIALRNSKGELIGFYEKHEYRTAEAAKPYALQSCNIFPHNRNKIIAVEDNL